MTTPNSLRRNPNSGFSISLGRNGTRRRLLGGLRPEGGFIPLDIDLVEVVAELDPGMVDWQGTSVERREGRISLLSDSYLTPSS
jgi:hypothetical protein